VLGGLNYPFPLLLTATDII